MHNDIMTKHNDIKENLQTGHENSLAMMWKYMTIYRRVQATEEAVDKVMDILNNLIEDMKQFKIGTKIPMNEVLL